MSRTKPIKAEPTLAVLHLRTDAMIGVLRVPDRLSTWNRLVGGYIELIPNLPESWRRQRIIGLCNEEGMLHALPINPFYLGEPIAGDAVLLRERGTEFDSLSAEQVEMLVLELTGFTAGDNPHIYQAEENATNGEDG